jgi:hypothetical protein
MSELYGRISSVQPEFFEVYTSLKSHQTYKCIYKAKFFPIQVGDSIFCQVEEYRTGFLRVITRPWILIGNDKESLILFFTKVLSKTRRDPEKFYDNLVTFTQQMEVNFEKNKLQPDFNEASEKVIQSLNIKATEYVTDKNYTLPECDFMLTKNILQLWYKDRVLRQLYLYGLNKKEIMGYLRYSQKTANDLLFLCYKRPTSIFSIDSEKLRDIIEQTKPALSRYDFQYYNLVRSLYKSLQDGEYCKDREELKDPEIIALQDNYSVTCKNDKLYLNYVSFVEDKLSHIFYNIYPKVTPAAIVDFSKIPNYLNEEQKEAFKKCITSSCTTVGGCAGSGKTTLIKELFKYYTSLGKTVILSALTGKAVAKLRECTQSRDPRTLHSLSKAISGSKVRIDVLIIDEISMLNGDLLYKILKLLAPYYPNLILVGDYCQLPCISWGSLDLTKLKNVCYLNYCQRFQGDILDNSQRILKGEPVVDSDMFKFIDGNISSIVELYKEFIDDDIQILSPYRKSVDEINEKIQSLRQGKNEWIKDKAGRKFVEKDRVIFCENNPDLDIFNGEEGIITKVTDEMVRVKFMTKEVDLQLSEEENVEDDDVPVNPDRFIEYTPIGQLSTKLIKLSYCLTVHKAQGSEWSIVIFYLPSGNGDFISRNLIYTGITRAKDCIFIVGKISQFTACCKKIAKFYPLDIHS